MQGDAFKTTARLIDSSTGNGLENMVLTFVFEGSTNTATTNSLGIASVTYTAPSLPGTYNFSASYAGDSVYGNSSDIGAVTVELRPTTLVASDVEVDALDEFIAQGKLLDANTASPIEGRTIEFVFQGLTQTATTNSIGIATVTYTAPGSTGTYTYNTSFSGDSMYDASSDAGAVTVVRRPSTLVASDVIVDALDAFNAEGKLIDMGTGNPIEGRSITFVFNAETKTAITNSLGVATVTYTAGSPGTYSYSSSFNGDNMYEPSSDSANVTVELRPTSMIASDVAVDANDVFNASAKLLDAGSGSAISARTIEFVFEGITRTALTNSVGVATVTYTAPGTPGSYTYSAAFAGDSMYEASSDAGAVTVEQRPTTLLAYDTWVRANDPFNVSAKLLDANTASGIEGKTIEFVLSLIHI